MQHSARGGWMLIVMLALITVFTQSACAKKNKVALAPATGIRIALLPFNTPADNPDLRAGNLEALRAGRLAGAVLDVYTAVFGDGTVTS